jgi:hypothetical protein
MFWDKLPALRMLRRTHPAVAPESSHTAPSEVEEEAFILIPDLTWSSLVEGIEEPVPVEATIVEVKEPPSEPPSPAVSPVFRREEVRDRVVRSLLDAGQVSLPVVERAWNSWSRGAYGIRTPLWRALLSDPAVDREQVYAQAAHCYAYRTIAIDLLASCCQIEAMMNRLHGQQWEQLVRHGLMPVVELGSAPGETWRLVLASHDPTHRQIESLLRTLDFGPVEVCHTPRMNLYAVTAESFPALLPFLGIALEPGFQAATAPVLHLVDPSTAEAPWSARRAA